MHMQLWLRKSGVTKNVTDSRSGGGPKETHLSPPTGVKDYRTFNYGVFQRLSTNLVMFGLRI